MNNPWLTVITVTKDDPPGVARTLASAAALRLAGAEHIVVDGSSDAVERAFPTGIRVMRRSPKGVADAFNAGLADATGSWIWSLNGGDQVDARCTPELLRSLLSITEADVLIGGLTYEGVQERRRHP